jgi:membrane-associated phospholipid phosphatase
MRLRQQRVLRVEQLEDRCLPSANVVLEWNQLALQAVGQARVSPVVASRALAITQAAVYDSVNAIDGSYEPYFAHVDASRGASLDAAAAQAAHDALAALFPSQVSVFDAALAADLVGIPPGRARQGSEVGSEVAQQILTWRSTDGSDATVPYTPGTDPGDWQPTPPANLPALAPQWPDVTPFAMTSGAQFRPAPPPALDSAAYAAAFNEVKDLGRVDSLTRTDEQTQIARFWNDGLGTAFAMGYWNRIGEQVATDQGLSLVQDARVFALLNIAEADAHIACWDAKYTYNLWRPVTAIRAADTDGNPGTQPDATWTPLLVTPNFPSYTSAHSTLSGAAAGVLTALFGADYHFTVGSEGLPGVTRSFTSFDAAAAEAGRSRVYGGIHYAFDSATGLSVGANLADYVMGHFLKPRDHGDHESQAAAAAPAPVSQPFHVGLVQPLLSAALAHGNATGTDVRIADLGGLALGKAAGNVIGMDAHATGWGRNIDATSGDQRRVDLVSVPEHENGPLLGRGHAAHGVTQDTLTAGTRLSGSPILGVVTEEPGVAVTGFEGAGKTS